MTRRWDRNEFKIAINMAGAVSAGAYTAGVLDFLMEALEEWHKAKDAYQSYLAQQTGAAASTPVPLHRVTVEAFSGASAGGMCAAIAAVMVNQEFVHIKTGDEIDTTNTFYECWVNKIDISELLKTQDIDGKTLPSLLDCTIIDEIADRALLPGPLVERPYISENLTLFLTLSNIRGVPYKLYNDPNPKTEEFIAYYGDFVCFETTRTGSKATTPLAKALPLGAPAEGAWSLLKDAAKATGAFPVFLAPRVLTRETADYRSPRWRSLCNGDNEEQSVVPAFGPDIAETWQTLNIDGGVIDNNPFQLAHDFLASHNPLAKGSCRNPRSPTKANCAVITIAPFPAQEQFDPDFDPTESATIGAVLKRLVSALISQSRFLGESLEVLTSSASFSRFVIAPSDPDRPEKDALQCGALAAFGGFFERDFRKHDFLLGRYNCQKFLMTHFCLPATNPIIASGLMQAGEEAENIKKHWRVSPLQEGLPFRGTWLPIIPLCGTAAEKLNAPDCGALSPASVSKAASHIIQRARAIIPLLGFEIPWPLRATIRTLLSWPANVLIKRKVRKALTRAMGPRF